MTAPRIGRPPRPARDDEARRHFGVAMPHHLRAQLEEAARASKRSMSAEVLSRLEHSFNPLYPDSDVREALLLLWIKRNESIASLARYLITVDGEPDDDEQVLRAYQVQNVASRVIRGYKPPEAAEPAARPTDDEAA